MSVTKAQFEAACANYHAACIGRDWCLADKLRLEAVSALEVSLDAVAMAYRSIEEAERGR